MNTRLMKEQKKLALIFGGSGFIGQHLLMELANNMFEVHIADLIPSKSELAKFHFCDVREKIVLNLDKSPDLVINLSAVHRTPGHEIDEYYETNVGGAINIIDWCTSNNVKSIFFSSSIATYGPGKEQKNEDSPLRPIHAYGKSKKLAEEIFRAWYEISPSDRKLVICRPAVIFGTNENGNYTRMAKAIRRGIFFIPGNTNLVKSSGYVGDLTKSIIFMMSKNQGFTVYNFCFPREITIREIANTLADIAKWKRPLVLPLKFVALILKRFGRPLSHVANRIEKLLVPTRISPKELIDANFEWKYDLESSLREWYELSHYDLKS